MDLLALLADAAPTNPWTPTAVLTLLLGSGAGLSVMGLFGVYFLRGLWARWGEGAMDGAVARWNANPAHIEAQKIAVKAVIDNEIRRDDGLIAREIRDQNDALEERLATAIEGLRIDREFKDNVLRELSYIQGMVRTLTKGAGVEIPNESDSHTGPHKPIR